MGGAPTRAGAGDCREDLKSFGCSHPNESITAVTGRLLITAPCQGNAITPRSREMTALGVSPFCASTPTFKLFFFEGSFIPAKSLLLPVVLTRFLRAGFFFFLPPQQFCRAFQRISVYSRDFNICYSNRHALRSADLRNRKQRQNPSSCGFGAGGRARPSPLFSSAGHRRAHSPRPPHGRAAAVPAARRPPTTAPRIPLGGTVPSLSSRPLLFEKAPAESFEGSRRGSSAGGGSRRDGTRSSCCRRGEKWSGVGEGDAVNPGIDPSHASREGADPAPAPRREPASAAPPLSPRR